jgi:hypothetical protein
MFLYNYKGINIWTQEPIIQQFSQVLVRQNMFSCTQFAFSSQVQFLWHKCYTDSVLKMCVILSM